MNRLRPSPLVLLLLAVSVIVSCESQRIPDPAIPEREAAPGDTVSSLLPLQDVLARNTPSLMTVRGVVGTGEGRDGDTPVIVVYVSPQITREDRIALPRKIEGYGVEIREAGDVTAPPH
jgi:hypothetical protein